MHIETIKLINEKMKNIEFFQYNNVDNRNVTPCNFFL